MPNQHTGVALEVHVDDHAVDSMYRWLLEDPTLGEVATRVDRGTLTDAMAPADWLQITANTMAVAQVLVGSVVAWRRSRRPVEPDPPTVRLRYRGREFVIPNDEAAIRRVLDALAEWDGGTDTGR